jgi:hypothetical protein
MWSVKKASRDPLASSEPIEVISRGHRLPKPYSALVRKRRGCVADKSRVPWPAIGLEHQESLSRYNLTFRISRIYLQPIGDGAVQCLSCLGAHGVIQGLYWGMMAVVGAGGCGAVAAALSKSWQSSRRRMAVHLAAGWVLLVNVQLLAFYITSHIR